MQNYYPPEEFDVVIVYGPTGIGKSAYKFKVGVEILQKVYQLEEKEAWEALKGMIIFHPEHFFEKIDEIESNLGRAPFLLWDDGGLWLFALDWNDPFIEAFLKWLNVARTKLAALMISTPSPKWVLKKLREFPEAITIRIVRPSGDRDPSHTWAWIRKARGYQFWMAPDLKKTGVNPIIEDYFNCKLPNEFYSWYKPVRDSYEKLARKLIAEKWEKLKEKSKALMLEKYPELIGLLPSLKEVINLTSKT